MAKGMYREPRKPDVTRTHVPRFDGVCPGVVDTSLQPHPVFHVRFDEPDDATGLGLQSL